MQFLVDRLKTQQGELAALGHPEYGSRHHELIGQPNVQRTQNLIKVYVLEALAHEPRIEKVLSAKVYATSSPPRDTVQIELDRAADRAAEPAELRRPVLAGGGRVSFAAEPYGVFVDDLVSSLTGGVTRERFVFLDENKPFQLAYAAVSGRATVRVSGIVNGAYFRFTPGTDFDVAAGDDRVARERARTSRPRARRGPTAAATSTRATSGRRIRRRRRGSPTATPAASSARSARASRASTPSSRASSSSSTRRASSRPRRAATSTRSSRSSGVERWTRSVASGEVVFSRSTPAPADIFIPAGTLVSTGPAAAGHRRDDGRADAPLGDALRDRTGARARRPGRPASRRRAR